MGFELQSDAAADSAAAFAAMTPEVREEYDRLEVLAGARRYWQSLGRSLRDGLLGPEWEPAERIMGELIDQLDHAPYRHELEAARSVLGPTIADRMAEVERVIGERKRTGWVPRWRR